MTEMPLGCSGQIAAMGKRGTGKQLWSAESKQEGRALSFPFHPSVSQIPQELSGLRERRKLRVSRLLPPTSGSPGAQACTLGSACSCSGKL